MNARLPSARLLGRPMFLLSACLLSGSVRAATIVKTTVLVSVRVTATCTVRTKPAAMISGLGVAVQCPRGAQYVLAFQLGSLAAARLPGQTPVQTNDGVTATITY